MKKLLLLLFMVYSFAFKVEFNNQYQIFITPNRDAILITKIFPISYKNRIITKKGMVLLNYNEADEFVRNSLYLPKNANAKDVKIAIFDIDKERAKIIQTLKNSYKNCQIEKIQFLDNTFQKVYFKPTNIELNYKTILNCH